ncbi:hypothetical protein [Paracoccus shandongensis]|uniref:hypothetical protein n=1 Tax=Paracoccus shandongensis TaxID=2816048 RepID=UPI001A8FBC3E|nr:hypothetical protein [Paracoccus shandongensis]
MIPFYLAIALVVLWSVWTGATRMAARSFRPLLAALAVLLAGAGACWLIGAQKSDYSALFATMIALLPLLAAGSVAFGAALRWVHDVTRRRIASDPDWPPARPWDVWGLCALSALSVIAALLV